MADAVLLGEADGDNAGYSVAGAGDVNADGYADLLVGAFLADGGGVLGGVTYLLFGPDVGSGSLSGADARLIGGVDGQLSGFAVDGAGDVDGDGFDDVLVGAIGEDGFGTYSGAAFVFLGPVSGTLTLGDADAQLRGAGYASLAGASLAGAADVDADGMGDILVGAPEDTAAGDSAGAAYLVHGPPVDMGLEGADAAFYGRTGDPCRGQCRGGRRRRRRRIRRHPDRRPLQRCGGAGRGRGLPDPRSRGGGPGSSDRCRRRPHRCRRRGRRGGGAYLIYGPVAGQTSLALADVTFRGEGEGSGAALGGAGDVDGEGLDDIIIGSRGYLSGGLSTGAAFVHFDGG